MNYKSGFCGKDSMRDKAMKEFGHEMKGFSMHVPDSNSSPARTNMRLYKKGGKVHGLSKMQVDLFIPTRAKQHHQKAARFQKVAMKNDGGILGTPNNMNTRIQQANELLGNAVTRGTGIKRGGKVKHHSHRAHHAEGGYAEGGHYAKGGHKSKHHSRRSHHAEGGHADGGSIGNLGREWIDAAKDSMHSSRMPFGMKASGLKRGGRASDDSKRLLKGEPLREGFHSGYGLRHGGKAHRVHKLDGGDIAAGIGKSALFPFGALKRGGKACKSEGGPMRGEHPVRGEHAARHCSYNDYESHMVGERTVRRKATGGKLDGYGMGGEFDGYAIGGVGKIRHKQATPNGMPIMKRGRKGRG